MNKSNKIFSDRFSKIMPSLIAIFLGLLIGFIIMLLSSPSQAIDGFKTILFGVFTNGSQGLSQMLYYCAPLLMTGLSIGFAFKTGLFNIGASGQFIIGAFAAVYVGVKWTILPSSIHWIVAIIAAIIFGGICAFIPGLLKAQFNVNEVVSSIMMNYISIYFVNQMVVKTVYDNMKNQSLPVNVAAEIPALGTNDFKISVGIIIAIISAIIIYVILEKTKLGFELKSCGFNKNASLYAGINTKKNIILSMVIAGMLSGLGGAILYLAGTGKHLVVADVIPSEGFSGISIALLANLNPLGIILSSIFISYITVGGFFLQMFDFPVQVVDMIISSIIYFSAFSMTIKMYIDYRKRKKKRDNEKIEEEVV